MFIVIALASIITYTVKKKSTKKLFLCLPCNCFGFTSAGLLSSVRFEGMHPIFMCFNLELLSLALNMNGTRGMLAPCQVQASVALIHTLMRHRRCTGSGLAGSAAEFAEGAVQRWYSASFTAQ